MENKDNFIAWLPQGSWLWHASSGSHQVLESPGICLVLGRSQSDLYEVLYEDRVWSVRQKYVKPYNKMGDGNDSKAS